MPLKLLSPGGGSVLLQANTTNLDYTLTVPAVTANVVTTGDTATIKQDMLGSGVVGKGPAFFVRQTASTQSLGNGSNVKITFNTKEFDTDTLFSTSTSRFTASVAGYYHFAGHVRWSPAGVSNCEASPWKNGSVYVGNNINQQGSNEQGVCFSVIMYLAVNDYVEVYVNQNGGTATTVLSSNYGSDTAAIWFCGYMIRAA